MSSPKPITPFAHRVDAQGNCVPYGCPACDWIREQEAKKNSLPEWFKKLFAAMSTLVLLSVIGLAQSAPTVEQCRADYLLWRDTNHDPSKISKLTIPQLLAVEREMKDCQTDVITPQIKWLYYNIGSEYALAEASRMLDFLMRHNLYDQMIAEDAEGKR